MFGVWISLPWYPTSFQPRSSARKIRTFGFLGVAALPPPANVQPAARDVARKVRLFMWFTFFVELMALNAFQRNVSVLFSTISYLRLVGFAIWVVDKSDIIPRWF